ncbi:FAD-dependent oxidoreductase [Clostridiales bacterium PH28_bin88]|nr:FAD-dependent oxidoreductase [Clostridiales bacterium PH28_bin88]
MTDSFDAVVVGAGPAGSAAAYVMARNNLSVALLERGEYPGSKTVFGGTVYRQPTEQIIPAFWHEAPLERPVVSDTLWFMDNDSAVSVGFTGLRFGQDPYNKFTTQRSLYDRWFAQKAAKAGADVRTCAMVDDLLYDKGLLGKKNKHRVQGVMLDTGEQLKADVVVLAEGVNAFLTKKAGLRSKLPAHTMTFYVEEILFLPSEKIEDRFQLERGEGATIGMLGFPTAGAVGKGGLFTYKEHVALIVGGYLSQLVERGSSPYELLQRTKAHPLVRRLLEGAETVQYKAHMIPKGGYAFVPKLYLDGLLVVGDAAVMVSGRRGTDLASLTGMYAAETIVQAKAKGDFSGKMLAMYMHKVNNTFFMKDIKAAEDGLTYYKKHPDSDYLISSLANKMAYEFFTVDMTSEKEKMEKLIKVVRDQQLPLKTFLDLYEGYRHWGVF